MNAGLTDKEEMWIVDKLRWKKLLPEPFTSH